MNFIGTVQVEENIKEVPLQVTKPILDGVWGTPILKPSRIDDEVYRQYVPKQ